MRVLAQAKYNWNIVQTQNDHMAENYMEYILPKESKVNIRYQLDNRQPNE